VKTSLYNYIKMLTDINKALIYEMCISEFVNV